jgi:peptidoglycan-associated lipoprotein
MIHPTLTSARTGVFAAVLAVGHFLHGCPLKAQEGIAIEARGGMSFPMGRLERLTDPGPTAGLQLLFPLGSRLSLGLGGDLELLEGAELTSRTAPELKLWRYGLRLEAALLDPDQRLSLNLGAGVGATTFGSDEFTAPGFPAGQEFSGTYFTPSASFNVGYRLGSRVSLHIGATGNYTSVPGDDTRALMALDPTVVRSLGSSWTVPVTLGIRVSTGRRSAPPPPPPPPATPLPAPSPRPPVSPTEGNEAERAAALQVLRERVHFDYDLAVIRPEAEAVLDRKLAVLRQYPQIRLQIEGHCDERGSVEYNQALGNRRATAVRNYLVSRGIAESRLETTSFGEERPLVPQSNEGAWSQNRRAEFVVVNPDAISGLGG